MTFGNRYGWLVLAVIMLAGVLIRQFFVLRHKGAVKPVLPALACILLAGVAWALAPSVSAPANDKVAFAKVREVIGERCVPCHAAQPRQEGFAQPPKGVMLETAEQISAQAPKINETVSNRYMPIGNLTHMSDDERALIGAWFAQGAKTQ